MAMLVRFLEEEKGQSGIEYVLILGGIILAVTVIFSMYVKINESSRIRINASSEAAVSGISDEILNASETL
jgi:Flp pilus assembly pilin Flp